MDIPLDGRFKRQEFTSNTLSILPERRYAAAALGGVVRVVIYNVVARLRAMKS